MKLSIAALVVGLTFPLGAVFTSCSVIADYAMEHHSYRRSSHIKATGPFASRFPDLYPDQEEAIREWFLDTLPVGISRRDARAVLSKSFSKDLTRRRAVVIDKIRSLVGGGSTSVTLVFDRGGRFESVEIEQQWDTIMSPQAGQGQPSNILSASSQTIHVS